MDINGILSVAALGISVITAILTLMLNRRPPAESQELAEIKTRLVAVDQEVTDVADRLGQWMRRESVRKMREGKEASTAELHAPTVADTKAELRRRLLAARSQS